MAIDRAGGGLGLGSPVNIPDADADGLLYGRQDNAWVEVNAGDTSFTPAGSIAAATVQDAIEELDVDIAALAGADPSTIGVGTYLISGATIAWQTGLQYMVGAATYYLDGTLETSAQHTVTLTAAHATLDRIDVLVLDAAGTLSAIAGTPGADPAEPSIDPSTYLRLGIVFVAATSTSPSITQTSIYAENAEWTATGSAGTFVANATTAPRTGTYHVAGTAVAANTYMSFVKPAAGTVDLAFENTLVFYVRVTAAWPSAKAIRLGWYSGTALRGAQVTISNGIYGFNSATTGVYQQIVVPISAFSVPAGNLVTTLRATIVGSGANVGFYIDDIVLNSGATTIPALAASRALVTDVSGNVAASLVTATELGYVDGVTSAIQTQINTKAPTASPTFTGDVALTDANTGTTEVVITNSNAGAAAEAQVRLVSDSGSMTIDHRSAAGGSLSYYSHTGSGGVYFGSGGGSVAAVRFIINDVVKLTLASTSGNATFAGSITTPTLVLGATTITATGTELNYVAGVTSAIQTQLNAKQASDADLTTIAGLTATSDNFMQAKSSAWASRTVAQVSSDLQATGLVTDAVGFRTVPANSQSAAYTTVAADSGKSIDHPSTDANARTFTIDSNANVAYPVGTCITFTNMTANVVTIAITSDTMYLAGAGTTGSRSLAQYGVATARKLTSTTWLISGTGLT